MAAVVSWCVPNRDAIVRLLALMSNRPKDALRELFWDAIPLATIRSVFIGQTQLQEGQKKFLVFKTRRGKVVNTHPESHPAMRNVTRISNRSAVVK